MDSPVSIPDCFASTDPLHLCDLSWEKEPEGGFIETLDEAGIPNISLSSVKLKICENEAPLIS